MYLYAQEYYQNRHLGGDGELHILVFSWIPKLVDDFPVSGDDDDKDNADDGDDDVDVNDVHDYDDDDIFGEIRCWLIAFLCQLHKEWSGLDITWLLLHNICIQYARRPNTNTNTKIIARGNTKCTE